MAAGCRLPSWRKPGRSDHKLRQRQRQRQGRSHGERPCRASAAVLATCLGPLISYELDGSVDDLMRALVVQSAIVARVADVLRKLAIPKGNLAAQVQMAAMSAGVVSRPVPAVT